MFKIHQLSTVILSSFPAGWYKKKPPSDQPGEVEKLSWTLDGLTQRSEADRHRDFMRLKHQYGPSDPNGISWGLITKLDSKWIGLLGNIYGWNHGLKIIITFFGVPTKFPSNQFWETNPTHLKHMKFNGGLIWDLFQDGPIYVYMIYHNSI